MPRGFAPVRRLIIGRYPPGSVQNLDNEHLANESLSFLAPFVFDLRDLNGGDWAPATRGPGRGMAARNYGTPCGRPLPPFFKTRLRARPSACLAPVTRCEPTSDVHFKES